MPASSACGRSSSSSPSRRTTTCGRSCAGSARAAPRYTSPAGQPAPSPSPLTLIVRRAGPGLRLPYLILPGGSIATRLPRLRRGRARAGPPGRRGRAAGALARRRRARERRHRRRTAARSEAGRPALTTRRRPRQRPDPDRRRQDRPPGASDPAIAATPQRPGRRQVALGAARPRRPDGLARRGVRARHGAEGRRDRGVRREGRRPRARLHGQGRGGVAAR